MRPSWSHKLNRDSSEKTTWCQSACQKAPLHAIHGAEDVDEADISTPLAVDQRAANCLEEAVRSFTAIRSRCRSSSDVTFRRPLPVFRVVQCSSVHCFQTRITLELCRCTRAPIAR
ncbi:uncharacterized protein TNCV_4995641 [Trichonephila clavipes]|nr:uncharacterized protein TNCV_4995641 [Trichonephila clavipes]